jgi:hypothetical protein
MNYSSSRYHPTTKWSTAIVVVDGAAEFVTLPDLQCDEVALILPSTGVSLDIIESGKLVTAPTEFATIEAPSGLTIPVAGNASEISVRRTDGSATPETLRFIWRKVGR